jgi:arginyl-tRNA synthetase
LSAEETQATAHDIAVGALRYFLLKFTRNSVIAFDFNEALSFEGETGPYCQYAAVRANSIFRKLNADAITKAAALIDNAASHPESGTRVSEVLSGETGTEIWSLVTLAERIEDVVAQCATSAEPANLAKYTFTLAKTFNLFYHRHRIVAEEDPVKRAVLIMAAHITRTRLTEALSILGINVPERM